MAPSARKLSLEEAIHDSPKTHAVLAVHEEDARLLRKFALDFHGYCERVHAAQRELAVASRGLAALMKQYGDMKFPLESSRSCMATTFPLMADYMEDVSAMQQTMTSQLSKAMLAPISRFITADLEELAQLQNLYRLISDEHELSVQRHARLSPRCSEAERCDAVEEVFHMRKKLHRTALHYFSSMNLVQKKRQFVFLESVTGHLQAHLGMLAAVGQCSDRRDLDMLFDNARGLLLCGHRELDLERANAAAVVASLEAAHPDDAFRPEPSTPPQEAPAGSSPSAPPLLSGYLMQRRWAGNWERLHFTLRRRGRLERRSRRPSSSPQLQASQSDAQQLLRVDLRGCANSGVAEVAAPFDMDERRHVFVVAPVGPGSASPLILQAESAHSRDRWIAAINEAAVNSEALSDSDGDEEEEEEDEEMPESEEGEDASTDELDGGQEPLLLADGGASKVVALLQGAEEEEEDEGEEGGSRDGRLAVAGAAFSRVFRVQLLGSCCLTTETSADSVSDAVLQTAAATAGAGGGGGGEPMLLAVSEQGVWLVEPASRLLRCRLPLAAARVQPAGRRLFGLFRREQPCRRSRSSRRRRHRLECLALRLCDTDSGGGATVQTVCAAVGAAARGAESAHARETALLLSNIDRLPNATTGTVASSVDDGDADDAFADAEVSPAGSEPTDAPLPPTPPPRRPPAAATVGMVTDGTQSAGGVEADESAA